MFPINTGMKIAFDMPF